MSYSARQSYSSKSISTNYGRGAGGIGQCAAGGGGSGGFGGGAGHYGGGIGIGGGYGGGAAGGYGGGGHGGGAGGGYGGSVGGGVCGGYGGGIGGGYGGGIGGGYGGGYGGGIGGGYGGGYGGGGGDFFPDSEKQIMQNLNHRLASYMDDVRALEGENAELERNIADFYDKQLAGGKTGEPGKDYGHYYKIIEDMKAQILATTIENAGKMLQNDNAKLAADDFRLKHEGEKAIRMTVEADTNRLRNIMDELTVSKSQREADLESCIEELFYLKKNHAEEMKSFQGTGAGQVSVEMNAAPGIDLTEIMNKMRVDYETLAEKNRRDAEEAFKKRSAELKKEISTGAIQVESTKSEVSELKRSLQALEIERQSLHAMKNNLEESLAQTEGQYCAQLAQLQTSICGLEEEIVAIRAELECQNSKYEQLLDKNARLEIEIEKYRKLLEGEGGQGSGQGSGQQSQGQGSQGSGSQTAIQRRIKKTEIIEEYDSRGNVISRKEVNLN